MDYGKLPNRTQPTLPSLYPVYTEISGRDIPSPLITSSTSTNSTWPPYDGDIVVARVASDLELSARNLPNAAVGMTFGATPANPSIDSTQPRIPYNPSAEEPQKADSGPSAATGAETEKEKPRAYIACQTCRSRKVRCDGVRPVCTNCTKRHQDCVYDDAPRRRGPDKNPGTRQRGPKGTSVAKKRKKNEELAKGSSNTPPANSEFVDSQPTASAAIAQESLSSESLVHPPHPTEARQKRTAATAGLPGATVPDAEVQSWPPVPFPAYEMPPSMVSQNSIHLPGSHPVPDRSRPSVSGLLAPVLEPVRPRAPPPFLLELESTAAEIAVLPDSITDNTPLHIPSVRTPEDTVSVQNKYGLQPWYPEMPTGRLTQLETFLYSQGIYQTNELQHPDYAKPIPIPYARLRPGSLSHPPATIVTVGEETDEAIYGGSSSGRPRQNDISREPSLRFTQDTWWDVILWLYNPQDRARAVREVQADLHCFFRDSSSWVSFINVQLFFNLFHHPDHRKLMQPALVLSCLAYSSWSQGSEAEGGAVQRTKAAKLRDLAQSAFDASYNAGWVDVMLAQAAWVLSLYEVSCHPETTGAKMEASIVLLDNVIHVLGLTSIDADNPRAPVFTRHMVPALGRPGPYATSNPNTLQSTSTHPLLYRHSSSAQRYIQYQATTQPTPFDTYRQVTNPFRSSGCPCNTISLSNVPEAARSTPFWLMSPMWKADLSYAEIRKEESRRLVWSTLALVGGESGARVALQAPQINLHVAKPENYALLYPGEALYASSPAIDSAFSGKESTWALYARTMLLWVACTRMRESSAPADHKTDYAMKAWMETLSIEDALNEHVCDGEKATMYLAREYLFVTRMFISYGFRRYIPIPQTGVDFTQLDRGKAMQWLAMTDLNSTAARLLVRRPYLIWWEMSQMSRALLLFSMDHSLTFAIDVALNILPIAQFLQAMWPCVGSVPAMMSSADNDDRLTVCQRNISNHPDHYYEDGNFIFVVENFVFRIHRSLLARRSGVMQSMLSLPQGPSSSDGPSTSMNDQPMIDGVPAVTLHDKAEDFANVLDFIYPRQVSDSGVSPPPILPLNTLMGITRICGKYDIEDIRTWAISQMEAVLPTTSETLDKIPIYDDPSVAVDVINISRECGLPQFLPLAFYALATTEWSSDVDAPTLVLGSLSEDDRDRILMGRAGLQKEVLKRAYQMPENGLTQRKCGKCSKGTLEAWINPEERWTRLLLHPLEEITQRLAWEYLAYCLGSCRKDAVKGAQAFREDLVQRLSTIFRLVAL